MDKDKKVLQDLRELVKEFNSDPEALHIAVDDYLIELLKSDGYETTARYLREIREHFWYA